MSSCAASFCVLLLLAVTFVSARPPLFVSANMRDAHESIADELKLKQPEVGSEPLFSFVIRNLNTSCQRGDNIHLMKAALDIYTQIFSQLLQQSHHGGLLDHLPDSKKSKVHSDLTELQRKLKEMKTRLSPPNHNKEKALSKLSKIQVENHLVQKKALAEFLEVYQAAESVTDSCS